MFDYVATQVLGTIAVWAKVYEAVVIVVLPLVLTGLSIQIIWYGIQVMNGQASFHASDVLVKNLRVFLVVSLALAGGAYAANVIGFFEELRNWLVGLFTKSPALNPYAALDLSIEKASRAVNDQLPWVFANIKPFTGNMTGLVGLGSMALMLGCLVLYALVSAANLLYINFAFAFIWAVGPIAIAALAFPAFARFFDSWLSAVLKHTMTMVVICAVAGLGNGILEDFCNGLEKNAENGLLISAAMAALGATGVMIFLAFRIPALAADLVGGIGLSLASPAALGAPSPGGGGSGGGALGAASNAGKSLARGALNAGAHVAGAAAGAIGGSKWASGAAQWASNTAVGKGAAAVGAAAGRFASATGNMKSGSVGAAFHGAAAGRGTGVISNGRPLTPPNL
jgi:type IV secretion system protein VirB6